MLLFVIIFNGALLRPDVDDLSMLAAFNLISYLETVTTERAIHLNFNLWTGQELAPEHNKLQEDQKEIEN